GFNVTGADHAGFRVRGMAEVPLGSAAFAFRAELFYNSLHSRPNSVASVGSGTGAAALSDRTFGLTGNFVASLIPQAGVSPYFLLGAGAFGSLLGTNPDQQSSAVLVTRGAMGLGLQPRGDRRPDIPSPGRRHGRALPRRLDHRRGTRSRCGRRERAARPRGGIPAAGRLGGARGASRSRVAVLQSRGERQQGPRPGAALGRRHGGAQAGRAQHPGGRQRLLAQAGDRKSVV